MAEPKEQMQVAYLAQLDTGGGPLTRYEPTDLPSALQLAQMISKAGLCPKALQGKPADILLVMMTGVDLGLTTNQALRNLHVVHGRVGMSADLIRARCQSHPDCIRFEVVEADEKHATIEVLKVGWKEPILVTWTLDEAKRAGLLRDGSGWQSWPAEMNVARATSRAGRRYFPGVMAGLYTPEELSDRLPEVAEASSNSVPPPTSKTEAIVAALKGKAVQEHMQAPEQPGNAPELPLPVSDEPERLPGLFEE